MPISISKWLKMEEPEGPPSRGYYGDPYDEEPDDEWPEGELYIWGRPSLGRSISNAEFCALESDFCNWEQERAQRWRSIREANPRCEDQPDLKTAA